MNPINLLAPRFSKRRLFLSIFRDFVYRPISILGRLSPINFHNYRICSNLHIQCCICGQVGVISYDYPDVKLRKAHGIGLLRETLRCKSCSATMRQRQLALGLIKIIEERFGQSLQSLREFRDQNLAGLRILDSDSFSPINHILRGMPGYVYSQFVPYMKIGEKLADGSINVNLEKMHFDSNSFDVILTSDVMEHVSDDESAHREIFRCLAPGGSYLFTVPFDPCCQGNRRLTQICGTGSFFFLEKHIHGDPHSKSGILAHRIYGWQLLDDLSKVGYLPKFIELNEQKYGVFGGDLFVAKKEF